MTKRTSEFLFLIAAWLAVLHYTLCLNFHTESLPVFNVSYTVSYAWKQLLRFIFQYLRQVNSAHPQRRLPLLCGSRWKRLVTTDLLLLLLWKPHSWHTAVLHRGLLQLRVQACPALPAVLTAPPSPGRQGQRGWGVVCPDPVPLPRGASQCLVANLHSLFAGECGKGSPNVWFAHWFLYVVYLCCPLLQFLVWFQVLRNDRNGNLHGKCSCFQKGVWSKTERKCFLNWDGKMGEAEMNNERYWTKKVSQHGAAKAKICSSVV